MRRPFKHLLLNCFCFAIATFLLPITHIYAQTDEELREGIKIGLSSDTIEIATDFTGSSLTIFGSLDNPRIETLRGGGYDIVVALDGPQRRIVVREKKRVFGIWVNADSVTFREAPRSYLIASTRAMRDIAGETVFKQLSLGIEQRYFAPANQTEPKMRVEEYGTALRALQVEKGLYHENEGAVRFISQNLFKASIELPANIPLGTHRARAFLFKEGQFIAEDSAQLYIGKDTVEQAVFEAAQNNGFLYGLFAVMLAIGTGWLGRVLFKRD